jgi:hypothetical protein
MMPQSHSVFRRPKGPTVNSQGRQPLVSFLFAAYTKGSRPWLLTVAPLGLAMRRWPLTSFPFGAGIVFLTGRDPVV